MWGPQHVHIFSYLFVFALDIFLICFDCGYLWPRFSYLWAYLPWDKLPLPGGAGRVPLRFKIFSRFPCAYACRQIYDYAQACWEIIQKIVSQFRQSVLNWDNLLSVHSIVLNYVCLVKKLFFLLKKTCGTSRACLFFCEIKTIRAELRAYLLN